jgi:hypothetical protein
VDKFCFIRPHCGKNGGVVLVEMVVFVVGVEFVVKASEVENGEN